jgi:hypothetical protein
MKKSYYLADANKVELFLGAKSTVDVTKRSKKLYSSETPYRKLRVRRINECSIEVSMQDYDGSRFMFLIDPKTELGRLIRPCFDGSSYEGLLLRQLWLSASDMLRQCRH